MPRIDRRGFLKASAALGALALTGPDTCGKEEKCDFLKGFIVSDAHFGWQHPQQPETRHIAAAIDHIIKRFPDLDVFVDTGDPHHGGATDDDRGEWTDFVAGGCGSVPFYYTAGNHDVDSWSNTNDPEWRCARLGSVSCRPYYSFDIKGVHFVSLPELLIMSYITQESLDWVKLDLDLNKDKSTIFFSHNSIKGTTEYHDDPGYRRLANSDQLLSLLNQYPNVLAWMHGHNHTYEVMEKYGKLFVSNGRIGGFDPPYIGEFGKGNLGGIYFEIGPDRLTVRSYSATSGQFFDEMGLSHLSKTLHVKTSFDPEAPACLSYGSGGARDGQRIPVVHHHTIGQGTQKLFMAGSNGPIINENPDFSVYAFRTHPKAPIKKILPGYLFATHHDEIQWEWLNPGLHIRPPSRGEKEIILVAPGSDRGKKSYYRCAPGKKYRASIDLELETFPAPEDTLQLQLCCLVYDRRGKNVATIHGPIWTHIYGKQTKNAEFQIPDLSEVPSIYSDAQSDNVFHAMIEARFTELMYGVTITRFAFMFAGAHGSSIDPAVIVEGQEFKHPGSVDVNQFVQFDMPASPLPARCVYELSVGGNRRLTWLVRQTNLIWQVRNAPVADKGDHLEIGPLRNTFSKLQEIVIAPMVSVNIPYVHRLRHVNKARVYPCTSSRQELKVEVLEVLKPAEIIVQADQKPRKVSNADSWEYADGCLEITIKQPATTIIQF